MPSWRWVCSSSATGRPSSATEPPSTTEPCTTDTTEALSSAETRLPDGTIKGMGFIDAAREEGGVRRLAIDYAELLIGEEAGQAAIEAGVIDPDEDLPNDYFVRNVNPRLREFTVSGSVTITSHTWGGARDQPVTWGEFQSFWSDSPPQRAGHMRIVPWWIIRDGTVVIAIEEQYLP